MVRTVTQGWCAKHLARMKSPHNRCDGWKPDTGSCEYAAPTPCAMCEGAPATTTWGLPVCQDCADGLTWLDGELAREEAAADHGRGSDDA